MCTRGQPYGLAFVWQKNYKCHDILMGSMLKKNSRKTLSRQKLGGQAKKPLTVPMVEARLQQVIDPELGVDIVGLGLIYRVTVHETHKERGIKIVMTLTSPGCPLAGVFDGMVRKSLEGLEGIDIHRDVEIELTFDPPWLPEMASEEVRAELGFD